MTVVIPQSIVQAAQAAQAKFYVPSSVSIAQWALESAWGRSMPTGSNNPFGIKARPGQPHVSSMTWEHLNGQNVRIAQYFAKYGSLAEAFTAHAQLLATIGLYKPAMNAWVNQHNLVEGVRLMAQHYATDPNYATKIMAIITANGLARYDVQPSQPHPSAVAGDTSLVSDDSGDGFGSKGSGLG